MALFKSIQEKQTLIEKGKVAGESNIGLVRSSNEDSYIYIHRPEDNTMLLGVADGMGGHEFGEVASFLVMKYLLKEWNKVDQNFLKTKKELLDFMSRTLASANQHIYHINSELKIQWCMGTTVTLGLIHANKLLIAQIGDSRCYRLRKKKLKQITIDQSWQEEMVMHGIMTREEAASHPLSSMLTNCVGSTPNLRIEFSYITIQAGDRYLFCTDGLSTMVDDETLQNFMIENDTPGGCIDQMIKQALLEGGSDNVTAVCLYL